MKKYGRRAAYGAAASGAAYFGLRNIAGGVRKTGGVKVVPLGRRGGPPRRNFGPPAATVVGETAAQGGYIQEETRRVATGRKEAKSTIARTLNSKDLLSKTLMWKNLPAQFSGVSGTMWLSQNTSNALYTQLPVYAFDLTQLQGLGWPVAQRLNIGTATNANPGVPFWTAVSGQDATGGTYGGMWPLRASPDFPAAAQPYIHYGAANINMVLYGNTTKNTTYCVSLVQFPDEDLAPCDDLRITNDAKTKHRAYWAEQVRRYITHPCENSVRYSSSKVKVLRTKIFKIAPTATYESDANPHHTIVRWRHQINKTIGMRLTGQNATTYAQETDARVNVTDTTGTTGLLTESPRASHRVYLMISSNDFLPATGDTNSNAASFDLSFNTTHYVTV